MILSDDQDMTDKLDNNNNNNNNINDENNLKSFKSLKRRSLYVIEECDVNNSDNNNNNNNSKQANKGLKRNSILWRKEKEKQIVYKENNYEPTDEPELYNYENTAAHQSYN